MKVMLIGALSISLLGCISKPVPIGVEVEFPKSTNPAPLSSWDKPLSPAPDNMKEVMIEGMLVYRINWESQQPVQSKTFDGIKPGLTLEEMVTMLGPGYQPITEGVGLIYWDCEDGRTLNLKSKEYKLDEKPKYWIDVRGVNQKHGVVSQLTRDLIAGIKITDTRVAVVLKVDTYQAKAGKSRYYGVGDCFQKAEPLPRIDFTIKQIDGNGVHCEYFYQAVPEGLIHYCEQGNLILKEMKANNTSEDIRRPADGSPKSSM